MFFKVVICLELSLLSLFIVVVISAIPWLDLVNRREVIGLLSVV
jgi:hypothetical protein